MPTNRRGRVCLWCMLAFGTQAGLARNQETKAKQPAVMVYVLQDNFKVDVLGRAEQTATRIFAAIGVPVAFHLGAKRKGGGEAAFDIEMRFKGRVPSDFHPGAMAYATPFADSGARIHIFCDRVLNPSRDHGTGAFLGHVMAHEIAHVLEGTDRHSAAGVLKARWDAADIEQILAGPLPFDPTDADLIRAALEQRARLSLTGR